MAHWTGPMTSAVRLALDSYVALQHRRLGVSSDIETHTPLYWSDHAFTALKALGDDAGIIGPLWRLVNAVLEGLNSGQGVPFTPLFLGWLQDAYGNEADDATVRAQLDSLTTDVSWAEITSVALAKAMAGDLPAAGALMTEAVTKLQKMSPFSPEEYVHSSDVLALFVDPYTSPKAFAAWQAQAQRLLPDARHILGTADVEAAEQTPHNILKMTLLDMLILASGDHDALTRIAVDLDCDAPLYTGGFSTFVEPYATLPQVHTAFATYLRMHPPSSSSDSWHLVPMERILSCQGLADVVSACGSVLKALPRDLAPPVVLSAHVLAANVGDLAAPPFAACTGPLGTALSLRHDLVLAFLRQFNHESTLWRVGATYLAFSPLSNPKPYAELLEHAARQKYPGPQPVLTFIAEHVDASSPFQARLRDALQHRVPNAGTMLAAVLSHFDRTMEAATRRIRRGHAEALVASGQIAAALPVLLRNRDAHRAEELVWSLLHRYGRDAATAGVLFASDSVTQVGVAHRSGLILPSKPSPAADADEAAAASGESQIGSDETLTELLGLCSSLIDVFPVADEATMLATGVSNVRAALDRAVAACGVAASRALPNLALLLVRLAVELGGGDVALEVLHYATAEAVEMDETGNTDPRLEAAVRVALHRAACLPPSAPRSSAAPLVTVTSPS